MRVTFIRVLSVISIIFLFISSFAESSVLPNEGFHMYLRNFALGQGIDVNLGTIPLNQLESQNFGLSDLAQKALNEGPSRVLVVLYVPKELSTEEKNEYGSLMLEKLRKSYPQVELEIQYAYSDAQILKNEMDADNKIIDAELVTAPQATIETRQVGRMMKVLNGAKLLSFLSTRVSDIRETIASLKSNNPHTQFVSIATAVGVTKAVVNSVAWIATSKDPGFAAYMSSFTSVALDIWFARYSNDWVDWKKQSRLTWTRFGFGKLAQFVNKTEGRRAWLVDQLNGLFWSHYFRTLSYMDNPNEVNPMYSKGAINDFWVPYIISGVTGGPVSAASQISINNLRQKGVLPPKWQYYSFLTFDVNFTLSSFLLQKGLINAYWAFVISEWAIRLGYVGTNIVLPAQYKKIVLIDPRIPVNDPNDNSRLSADLKGILHREGISSPQDAERALSDWDHRIQSSKDPKRMDMIEKAISQFEKFVAFSFQNLMLLNAQRVTGVNFYETRSVCSKIFFK